MTSKYLHITLPERVDGRKLKRVLDRAEDWVNYSPNCFIIRSDEPAPTWAERLRPLIADLILLHSLEHRSPSQGEIPT